MPARLKLYRPPDVLRAPPLSDDESLVGDREKVVTFADLPLYPRGQSVYTRPTLEELVLELARSSLHGMKSRWLPRAAKILVSGTEEEREWLTETIRKKQRIVRAREDALASKLVFNRKVASAMGSSANKGQVSLLQVRKKKDAFLGHLHLLPRHQPSQTSFMQVREHTWNSVIVEARREFFVNKLRLEAFESEERQARRWSVSMTRDIMQHLTMLSREEVDSQLDFPPNFTRVVAVCKNRERIREVLFLVSWQRRSACRE